MACLSLTGEKQQGLIVLVLHSGEAFSVEQGNIMFELACRMRIQIKAYPVGSP